VAGVFGAASGAPLEFFGRSIASAPAPACTAAQPARISEVVAAADGEVTASVSIAQGRGGSRSAIVHQAMVVQARLRPDGCGLPESLLPEIALEGPAHGLPDVSLVDGKARFEVSLAQLLAANPELFPAPRALCPGDTITVRHRFDIDGCSYESLFTVRNGASLSSSEEGATIDGSFAGDVLQPRSVRWGVSPEYTFVFTHLESVHTDVAISDFAGYCGPDPLVGMTLYLSLFQNALLPNSEVTRPGSFDVWLPVVNGSSSPGTGNRVVALLMRGNPDGTGSGELARSGHVWIDAVPPADVRGRFDLMIGGDHVTGSFTAPNCSPWLRSGDIP
jgi:hypothetical protein